MTRQNLQEVLNSTEAQEYLQGLEDTFNSVQKVEQTDPSSIKSLRIEAQSNLDINKSERFETPSIFEILRTAGIFAIATAFYYHSLPNKVQKQDIQPNPEVIFEIRDLRSGANRFDNL